jgi:hypothetical protein
MTETNIRIVKPGVKLEIKGRILQVHASELTPELRQKLSKHVSHAYNAVTITHGKDKLFVVTTQPLAPREFETSEWFAEVKDIGAATLKFTNKNDRIRMAYVVERQFLRTIKKTDLWNYGSPRHWYERIPLNSVDDIDAFRRYEVSALPIENEGIGISVTVSTTFFTRLTVADYFDRNQKDGEYKRRQKRFNVLSQRQMEQRGTLLYDNGRNPMPAYFDRFGKETCGGTPILKIGGDTYKNLLNYYDKHYPDLGVGTADTVAYVSFRTLPGKQPVAAKLLRLRVMNEGLPKELKKLDKIRPYLRVRETDKFWKKLGDKPFENVAIGMENGYWQPQPEMRLPTVLPNLLFGGDQVLCAPASLSFENIKAYHHTKMDYLNQYGCWYVPPNMPRTIYQAVPMDTDKETVKAQAQGLEKRLKRWTGKSVEVRTITYKDLEDAFRKLTATDVTPSVVLFVFEEESSLTYARIAQELDKWRVKRVTKNTLDTKGQHVEANDWHSFLDMTCLDILQNLDCAPWIFKENLPFDAVLTIDVGRDKKFFALSLMLIRNDFSFRLITQTYFKTEENREIIDPRVLRDAINDIFERADIEPTDLIGSLLVLRDGRLYEPELLALKGDIKGLLISKRFLSEQATLAVVEIRKKSLKGLRLWERVNATQVELSIENTAFRFESDSALLATTGAPSLHQGTPEPMTIKLVYGHSNLGEIVQVIVSLAQLNWSSPTVAQRLPQPLERTDEALKKKYQQAIQRLA